MLAVGSKERIAVAMHGRLVEAPAGEPRAVRGNAVGRRCSPVANAVSRISLASISAFEASGRLRLLVAAITPRSQQRHKRHPRLSHIAANAGG